MLVLFSTLTALALLAVIVALRGRLVGEHLHCRRCKFNLYGLPESASRCPECGSEINLTTRAGMQRGVRRARKRLAISATILLLVVAVPTALMVITNTRSISLYTYAPMGWLLLRQSDHRAIDELMRRDSLAPLDAQSANAMVANLLQIQGDPARVWQIRWGSWVESREGQGKLSAQQWATYARQSVPIMTLNAKPIVIEGDWMPLTIHLSRARAGSGTTLRYLISTSAIEIDQGGLMPLTDSIKGDMPSIAAEKSVQVDSSHLAPGEHHLRLPVIIESRRPRAGRAAPADHTETQQLTASFTILSTNAASSDPELLRPEIEKAINLVSMTSSERWTFTLARRGMPVDLAFEVFVRIDDREIPLDLRITFKHGEQGHASFGFVPPAELKALQRVDVVLRSNTALARDRIDLNNPWNGDLLINNVPITPGDTNVVQFSGEPNSTPPQFDIPTTRPASRD